MKKDWYEGDVKSILRDFSNKIDTYNINRPIYIYCIVDKIIKLNEDYKNCENYLTKKLIEEEMKKISYELKNYSVYDDRFKEICDDGK